MKHTKGKWEVVYEGDAKQAFPAIVVGKYLEIRVSHAENFGDPLPDARLIASAPELLEACKQLLNACKRDDVLVRHISNAEQAIAKAE